MRAPIYRAMDIYDDLSPDIFAFYEWPTSSADVNNTTGNFGDTSWWAYGACAANATYGGTDPRRWCSLQVITYNLNHPDNWDGTTNGLNTVACHEIGHTIGLRHSVTTRTSCMRNGVANMPNIHVHDDDTLVNFYE